MTPQGSLAALRPVSRRFCLLALALIILAGLAVYINSFDNAFLWDDLVIIPPNEFIQTFDIAKIFTTDVHHFSYQPSNFYRPLQMLSYAINYKLGKLEPFSYHLLNTGIHIFNGCLLFLIFLHLNNRLQLLHNNHWRWLALGAALIWLVHPIHTQNTTYISGRADLLVTLFVLSSFYCYARQKNTFLVSIFFIAALCSKESGMITPLLLILYDIIVDHKFANKATRLSLIAKNYGPLAAILLVYIALRASVFNFPTAFTTEQIPSIGPRLLTSARAIVSLWSLLLVPRNLSMLRNIDWSTTLFEPMTLGAVIVVLGLLAAAVYLKNRRPFISFCLLWFFITYLPVANIVPMNANMSEHWMYLPSMMMVLLGVYFLYKSAVRAVREPSLQLTITTTIILGAIVIYGYQTFDRNKDFTNEIVFFEHLLTQHPDNTRAHYNLGTAYGTKGDYAKAEHHFERALETDPQYAPAHANLGLIFSRRGNIDKAIELYEKANTLQDNLIENHANLGIAYAKKGRSKKAITSFKKVLSMNPKHPAALNGIGIEYAKRGEYEKAEEYFEKVLHLYPGHPDATNNLRRLQALQK